MQVLGNRSMKLKYLNPNVLFVASGQSESEQAAAAIDSTLTVQLIDTITGQVVYRQTLEVGTVDLINSLHPHRLVAAKSSREALVYLQI